MIMETLATFHFFLTGSWGRPWTFLYEFAVVVCFLRGL
jgi:hypothetical protein